VATRFSQCKKTKQGSANRRRKRRSGRFSTVHHSSSELSLGFNEWLHMLFEMMIPATSKK
jgi:hypothetical protein